VGPCCFFTPLSFLCHSTSSEMSVIRRSIDIW
jgi:hypothetical protein